jgi:predicted permease
LEDLQGVEAATVSDGLPAAGNGSQAFEVEGREYPTPESFHQAREGTVTPGYFRTFQTELIHGRAFLASDREGKESVCIVNETFARNFFDGDALGKRIRKVAVDLSVPGYLVQDPSAPWLRVVGVAPDMHMEGIGNNDQSPAGYYVPVAQMPVGRSVSLAVRTRGSPLELVGGLRSAVESIDSNLPIYQVLPMRGVIHRQTWFYRVFGTLFMSFGFAALFLAAVGLFGVMSFAVSQRTREFGVRMALGAQGGQLMAMVLRKSALQLAVGLGIGLVLAILAAGPLQMILFEVDARDPVVIGSVTLTLAGAGFLATFLPARRVTKVDPVTALTPG